MKELFRSPDSGQVAVHRAVLEAAGLQCFVRNEFTQQALVAGIATAFLPLPDFWPTLCLVEDENSEEAMEIMRTGKATGAGAEDWACPHCKQPVPGNFELCWSCHEPRTGEVDDRETSAENPAIKR